MSIEQLINMLENAGMQIGKLGLEILENYIKEEHKNAEALQRENDVINVVITLSDIGKTENEIYDLLSKFWNIDSRKEATHYINIGRYTEWPYLRLKNHLRNLGYSSLEIIKFTKDYNVREKLKNNPNFCKLNNEQLMSKLMK
ncbi:MAG: hypothetical protein ACLRVU_00800 [Beduini sp.]|uniref:hypothetical protein n=1 Tax=Beduini sp. TaxID=1922300 RepID=UPI0039A21B30